jgi:RNA-directed DNA polymerase
MPGRASFDIHGLPVIDNVADLGAHAHIPDQQLWRLIFAGHNAYTIFPVAKKSGGFRLIAHPRHTLKLTQRWILRNILDHLKTTPSSYGFERGSKLRVHAQQHLGAQAILRLDIENFFPSISVAQTTRVFRVAGYSSSGAWALARLCTCMGSLPQGAPTSPRIANLVCFRMDRRLSKFSEGAGLVYTRYADDLTFSSDSASLLAKVRPFIGHIVHDSGFRLNERKAALLGPRRAKVVTGLVLGADAVGIGRVRLRELRARIHRAHLTNARSDLAAIQGWLDYVSDTDPRRYSTIAHYVQRLRASNLTTGIRTLRLRGSVKEDAG